jgi:hypothetical protein
MRSIKNDWSEAKYEDSVTQAYKDSKIKSHVSGRASIMSRRRKVVRQKTADSNKIALRQRRVPIGAHPWLARTRRSRIP